MKLRTLVSKIQKKEELPEPLGEDNVEEGFILINKDAGTINWGSGEKNHEIKGIIYSCKIPEKLKRIWKQGARRLYKYLDRKKLGLILGREICEPGWLRGNLNDGTNFVICYKITVETEA